MEEKTMMVKKGGYKYQLSDDTTGNYIVKYQPTEDPTEDVNSGGLSRGRFDISFAKRTYHHCVVTRRDPNPFETEKKGRSKIVYDRKKCGQ